MNRNRIFFLAFLLAYMPLAQAHIEQASAGFMSGLLHPVYGLDHFLAMFAVGLVSAQLGGRSIYTIPAVFVSAMVIGGIVGVLAIGVPFTEQGIALSVVVLGLAIVLVREGGSPLPVLIVTACFGFLHGHAHGLEMPKAADPVYYAAGFVVSTASIHLLGVGVGHVFTNVRRLTTALRHLGSAMAGVGMMILMRGLP
ncbi:MAG: HupE/UreJ family protein [Telluria sp.]